jgi:hypothetical protein
VEKNKGSARLFCVSLGNSFYKPEDTRRDNFQNYTSRPGLKSAAATATACVHLLRSSVENFCTFHSPLREEPSCNLVRAFCWNAYVYAHTRGVLCCLFCHHRCRRVCFEPAPMKNACKNAEYSRMVCFAKCVAYIAVEENYKTAISLLFLIASEKAS